jgi:hypothetical protein
LLVARSPVYSYTGGMRLLIRCSIAALLLAAVAAPTVAHAQTTTTLPPLEDVTLRGRVVGANGSAVANTPLRVDAVNDSGFAIVGFFFSLGFSTLSCFGADKELCPLPNSKRFNGSTDAHGNYSFTFHNAHRRGVQTDTDYILSIGVPSRGAADTLVVASYELELQDAVHNAPDLRMWDPAVTLSPGEREYKVAYQRRASSKNGAQILFGDKPANIALADDGGVDARAVEDQTFSYVANAAKDVTAAGTIYHQRFTAAPVTRKGALVPLSRGAPCTATRADGATAHCGYTDGDLVTPGVVDSNPCGFVATQQPCQQPVTKVTIDLGASKNVGEIRTRCGCAIQASNDGATWFNLPARDTFGPQKMRYVAVTNPSLGPIPEISVWPPWPDSGNGIGLLPGTSPGGGSGTGGGRPWLLAVLAVAALGLAVGLSRRRRGSDRNDVAEVGRPL